MTFRMRNTDVFALINATLFGLMCAGVYYRRYLAYNIVGNFAEFTIYAFAIFISIGLGARYLRKVVFPNWILLVMQVGILAHFAGGFVPVGGRRLYDTTVLGLSFDHYVHALNAFAGAAVANRLVRAPRAHPHLQALLLLLVVQGGGAIVEIVEYGAHINVTDSGVGDYDNNMQDLVSNLIGALIFLGARFAANLYREIAVRGARPV